MRTFGLKNSYKRTGKTVPIISPRKQEVEQERKCNHATLIAQ